MDDRIQFGVDFDREDIATAHYKFWLDVATLERRVPNRFWKAMSTYFKVAGTGEGALLLSNEAQDEIYTQLCVKHYGGPLPSRVA